MNNVKFFINYSGYCLANVKHVIKGEKSKLIKFNALYALISHPDKGYILFDTGYTRRFYDVTKSYPNKIYAKETKVTITKSNEVKSQLESIGIKAEEIKHIIISHFHADHIGGLKDFKNANIYCSKKSYNQVKSINNFFAFSKGILKDLIPIDIETRLKFIEDISIEKEDEIFQEKYDLFQDQTIMIYNLPGHAAGQIGILLNTLKNKYFLISDACWDIRAITNNKLPNKIVRLFFDSWQDYICSIENIKRFKKLNPEITLIPSHCSKTTDILISEKLDINVL